MASSQRSDEWIEKNLAQGYDKLDRLATEPEHIRSAENPAMLDAQNTPESELHGTTNDMEPIETLFDLKVEKDGVHLQLKGNKRKLARMKLAKSRPKKLKRFGELSPAEYMRIDYYQIKSELKVSIHSKVGKDTYKLPFALWIDEVATKRLGLWEQITEMKVIACNPLFQKFLYDSEKSDHHRKRGNVYHIPISVQPTHTIISLCRLALADDKDQVPKLQRLTTLSALACDAYISEFWPEMKEGLYAKAWARKAAPLT